jgi:hypothetical protein
MPHFIEGLTDVQECRRTIFAALHCSIYYTSYTVYLLSSSVFLSETELVIRYKPFFV